METIIKKAREMFESGFYTIRIFTRYPELKRVLDSLEFKKERYICNIEKVKVIESSGQELVAGRLICANKKTIYEEFYDWSNNKFFGFSAFEILKYLKEKAYFFFVEEMEIEDVRNAILWVYEEENPRAYKRELLFCNPISKIKEQREGQKRNVLIQRIEKMGGEVILVEALGMKRNIIGAIEALRMISEKVKYIYTSNSICDEMCFLKIIACEEKRDDFQITFEGILHSFNVTIVQEKNKKSNERTAEWLMEGLGESIYGYSFNLSRI